MNIELINILTVSKDGQCVFKKNQSCIPKGELSSCKKSVADDLKLEQEGD